jgi:hypothetical protein
MVRLVCAFPAQQPAALRMPWSQTNPFDRTSDDEVLVMASDGLWDVLSNQEAVDVALHTLQVCSWDGHARTRWQGGQLLRAPPRPSSLLRWVRLPVPRGT